MNEVEKRFAFIPIVKTARTPLLPFIEEIDKYQLEYLINVEGWRELGCDCTNGGFLYRLDRPSNSLPPM